MAMLDPLHPLQSCTIEALSKRSPLSIIELHDRLTKDHKLTVSRQNLYRMVSLLLDAQVLVRERGAISLNRIWVSHTVTLGETLARTYFSKQKHESRLPSVRESRKEMEAGSLAQLDPMWTDALVELSEHVTKGTIYAFNSHPWYSIGMADTERRIMEGLINRGVKVRMVYGNETFLDLFGQRLIDFPGFHSVCSSKHTLPRDGYAVWVAGSYILEVTFPRAVARQFEFFFNTVQAAEQLDIELFSNIFKLKARTKLAISKDATRANAMRRTLQKLVD